MALSRRDFLKVGGSACIVAGAGAALAGCSPNGGRVQTSAKPAEGGADASVVGYEPVSFDQETDILIIGTGYAGLAAAMAPALAGKKIVLRRKAADDGRRLGRLVLLHVRQRHAAAA